MSLRIKLLRNRREDRASMVEVNDPVPNLILQIPTPSKTRKGKAVDRVSNDERNLRRPPSAPPPSTSISVETTFVDLRNPGSRRSSSRNGTETEEEVPTRPSTPPNRFARTVSEEPSPSRRVRAVPVNVNGERRDLGTPRKITVIPIQSGSGAE
ncbi:hypothetical protein QCA50_000734 [Cerrena zonata]|uniref:Uncharacterized protein n=1 Tax=Cerrena zonata TaxID=2478898 RepID=A0AAW0H0D0_9APHY